LANCLFRDVGTFHNLIDFERLLTERPQDIFSIIQHDYARYRLRARRAIIFDLPSKTSPSSISIRMHSAIPIRVPRLSHKAILGEVSDRAAQESISGDDIAAGEGSYLVAGAALITCANLAGLFAWRGCRHASSSLMPRDQNIPVDKGACSAAGSLLVRYACLHDRRRRRY
jgi:hypothetical protein